MPPHATSGNVVGERAQVLPGYWAVTQERQSYGGAYGILRAGGAVEIHAGGFRRFPNPSAAERALSGAR